MPAADGRQSLYAAIRRSIRARSAGVSRGCACSRWSCCSVFSTALPWLQWDGRQAVLFDLPARKFYIFGLTLLAAGFFLLTWLLIIAALSLFFFTALAGRLWCGYACPQTVWTEVFVWIERWTEGNRARRISSTRRPWTARKLLRKGAKQVLWVGFCAVHRLHLRRIFRAGPRPGAGASLARPGRLGSVLGVLLFASPPTAMPASCASRSASTCVRTRASRARCSTAIR